MGAFWTILVHRSDKITDGANWKYAMKKNKNKTAFFDRITSWGDFSVGSNASVGHFIEVCYGHLTLNVAGDHFGAKT